MGKGNPKPYKPHELSQHVAAMFRMLPHNDMLPVEMAMRHAITTLQAVQPTTLDLTDPDNGISYALGFKQGEQPEKVRAAAELLRMCLHAAERGETTENERVFIPLTFAALAGFLPDQQKRNASKSRPRELDALDRGLDDALKVNPHGEWTELAYWLEGEGVVTKWGADELTFTDGQASEKTIAIGTYLNRITAAKKRRG